MFKSKSYTIDYTPRSIAIQGQLASFSHQASDHMFNGLFDTTFHCFDDFDACLKSVADGQSDIAVVPYRNTIAGNVPYVHSLQGKKKLSIIGEFHLGVQFHLLTLPGASIDAVLEAHSHSHGIGQCSKYFAEHSDLKPILNPDTGGAAKMIAELNDPTKAAIASSIAAERYGLEITASSIQDDADPITRFFVFGRNTLVPELDREAERPPRMKYVTNLHVKPRRNLERAKTRIFKIFEEVASDRHEPSLEAYYGPNFRQEGYLCEFMGHVEEKTVKRLTQRLKSICSEVDLVGCYEAHHFHRFPHRVGPQRADGSFTYGL